MFAVTPFLLVLVCSPRQEPIAPPSRQIGELSSPILALAVSPDGDMLFTAAKGEIGSWDLEEGTLRWKCTMSPVAVLALDVSDELVAFHFGIPGAGLLDVETGVAQEGLVSTNIAKVTSIAIDPKDRWIWLGAENGMVTRVVPESDDSSSDRSLRNGGVTCLALDAGGKRLVVGGSDGTIRFVDGTSANVDDRKVLKGHRHPVTAVAVSSRGKYVVSGSEGGGLRVWKVSNGKCLHVLDQYESAVQRVAIDPKASHFASGDADGTVRVWNLERGELVLTLAAAEGKPVSGLAFAHKGKTLVTAGGSGKATLWDLSDL